MPTARNLDDNGFLLVKGCPLSSFGIFDYSARQVGLPGDPNRIVKVYRPESAVNDPAAIDSFKNVPFIDEHVMLHGTDDAEGMAPEKKGIDGVLTSNVYYDAPWMRGDLKIFSRKLQDAINKHKRDLSLGYGCTFEHKPGIWNGQPYEVVQDNLRGNHIALVGEGRVPGARVLDGLCFDHLSFEPVKVNEDDAMPKPINKKVGDGAVEQLKALLPQLTSALENFLSEEQTEPAHQEGGAAEPAGEATPAAASEADTPDAAPGEEGSENAEVPAVEESQASPITSSEEEGAEAPAPAAEAAPANASEGGAELPDLIAQVKKVLAQLESVTPGASAADEDMSNEQTAIDAVEGLADHDPIPGAQVVADEAAEQPKASPGPSAGKHTGAQDASLRNFYADVAVKNGIYDRLSKVVGAFDHSAMDSSAVVSYGVTKLKLKVGDSKPIDVLTAHLDGIDAANKAAAQKLLKKSAADSAGEAPEIDAYIKGTK